MASTAIDHVPGAHDHDHAGGVGGFDLKQNLNAVDAGQHDIEQNQVTLPV